MSLESRQKRLILLPGLDDHTDLSKDFHKRMERQFTRAGVQTIVYPMHWTDSRSYQTSHEGAMRLVEEMSEDGVPLFTGGTSVGGSEAVNLFIENQNVAGAFAASSRLHTLVDREGLANLQSESKKAATAVYRLEKNKSKVTRNRSARILTMRPEGGDEKVAYEASTIPGATDKVYPFSATHRYGMALMFALEGEGVKDIVRFMNAVTL